MREKQNTNIRMGTNIQMATNTTTVLLSFSKGEEWEGTHSARLIEGFCEVTNKRPNEWTVPVREAGWGSSVVCIRIHSYHS